MNILFYVKTKQNLHNIKLLGGIEILNYNLNNFFKKKNLTILTNKIAKKGKEKYFKLFKETRIAKYIIEKSLDNNFSYFNLAFD